MSKCLLLALLAAAAAVSAADRAAERERRCEAVKEEIRKLQSRQRRGYAAAEGVKLNAKLLELRKKRARLCRGPAQRAAQVSWLAESVERTVPVPSGKHVRKPTTHGRALHARSRAVRAPTGGNSSAGPASSRGNRA